jgi:hypothetical protein
VNSISDVAVQGNIDDLQISANGAGTAVQALNFEQQVCAESINKMQSWQYKQYV